MKAMNGRMWKVAVLLSLIVPIGSLATIKLSGLSGGTATVSAKIALTPTHWEFERPSWFLFFNEQVYSEFSGDVQLNETLRVNTYDPGSIYGNSPTLDLHATLTASVPDGFVDSVNVTYFDSYDLSWILVESIHSTENVTKTSLVDRIRGPEKGFVGLQSIGHPQTIYLDVWTLWLLESSHNQTQTLNMMAEVTYFNGTIYKKITQPFEVRLVSDDDNSSEKASELQLNQTLVDWLGGDDGQDFFKVHLTANDTIRVNVTLSAGQNLDIFLFNSSGGLPVCSSIAKEVRFKSIEYTTSITDWYFVKVEREAGDGIYLLNATVAQG